MWNLPHISFYKLSNIYKPGSFCAEFFRIKILKWTLFYFAHFLNIFSKLDSTAAVRHSLCHSHHSFLLCKCFLKVFTFFEKFFHFFWKSFSLFLKKFFTFVGKKDRNSSKWNPIQPVYDTGGVQTTLFLDFF